MKRQRRFSMVRGFSGFFLVTTICATVGYVILSFFNFTGIWQTLFSLWVGSAILAVTAAILHFTNKGKHERRDLKQHHDLLDAMHRIAQGDFSIFLQTDDFVHAELVDAVNTMAKNLGNLELMRQDFISNVSHEIQSPLTSIGGFAALLKKSDLPENERLRYVEIIEAESKRLSSLSDNLLKLSSLDNNKMQLKKNEFRLDKQIENTTLTLEPQWNAKSLSVELDLQKLTVYGDEGLLSQAWMNLLHNAVKFTPDHGQIRLSLAEETDSAVLTVSDSGIGISPEDQIHIFERFYKADKSRDRSLGGNGLGLSLVKKIVDIHGGCIRLESKIGYGSVFTITIPKN